jgi:ribosome biogenesis GTPase A
MDERPELVRISFRSTADRLHKLVRMARSRGWFYGRAGKPNVSAVLNKLVDEAEDHLKRRSKSHER